MKPIDLDNQSPVKIDRWLDLDSAEWKELDPDSWLTKKMLRVSFEADAIETDTLGRVWSKPNDPNKTRFPFHFNLGSKLYGIRIPVKAAN